MIDSNVWLICKIVFIVSLMGLVELGVDTIHDKIQLKYKVGIQNNNVGYRYKLSLSYVILAIILIAYVLVSVVMLIKSREPRYIISAYYSMTLPVNIIANSICGFRRKRRIANVAVGVIFHVIILPILDILL